MAHEFESGFFVAKAAWHRLGKVLNQAPTTAEAIAQAELDWRVLEEPFYRASHLDDAGEPTEVALRKRLVRDRDQKELGVVNPDYTPLQNQDAFRWFDSFLESGALELEAAGSLQGGKRVWILAKLVRVEADIRYGDWVRPYLLLHNSHDGSTAAWIQFTPVRVVCMNTLAGAAAHRFGDLWQKKAVCIPHTLTLPQQMARLQNLVNLTRREFQISVEEYRAMESQEVNDELLATYMGNVLNTARPWRHTAGAQLRANFEQGTGNRGQTLWDAYNAVTEWIDHQRAVSPEARLQSTWLGSGCHLRRRAHQAALALVQQPAAAVNAYHGLFHRDGVGMKQR